MKNKANVNDLFLVSDTTFQYSIERPSGTNGYEDFFVVDKKKFGVNFKFGYQLNLNSNLYLDGYFGLGFAIRKSTHYGRENMKDEFYDKVLSSHNKAGISYLISLPLNIKIGYKF